MQEMWETWIWSLGQKETLEKEMATDSSILAWEIPWAEEPGGLQSMRLQRVGHDWSDLAQHIGSAKEDLKTCSRNADLESPNQTLRPF